MYFLAILEAGSARSSCGQCWCLEAPLLGLEAATPVYPHPFFPLCLCPNLVFSYDIHPSAFCILLLPFLLSYPYYFPALWGSKAQSCFFLGFPSARFGLMMNFEIFFLSLIFCFINNATTNILLWTYFNLLSTHKFLEVEMLGQSIYAF